MTKSKTKGGSMKRLFSTMAVFLLLFFYFIPSNALAYNFQINSSTTPSTAPADNLSKITARIAPCDDGGGAYYASTWLEWSLIGSGVSISAPSKVGFPSGGLGGPAACGSASVTWQVSAAAAGAKTLSLKGTSMGTDFYSGAITVTFTAASSGSSATISNTAVKNTATQTQSQTAASVPTTPVLEKIKIQDQELKPEEAKDKEFKKGEKIVFSGKTIPNGVVRLYFQSDPFEDTATADKDGNWSYELTKDLGEGEHTLQIAVTDPASNKTSEKSVPITFKIAGVQEKTADQIRKKSYLWYGIGGSIIALALVAGGATWFILRRKKRKAEVTA